MGLKQEKHLDTSEILWENLSGRKIILAGISNRQKESFWQSLTYKSSQMGEAFEISDDLEHAGENDYVFLFSGMEHSSELNILLEQLKVLAQKKIASAVLMSDSRVYGKLFGTEHELAEHELGYVCHTSAKEQAAAGMRMAENLAYRLAEEGFPIRIVRMDAAHSGESLTGDALTAVLESAVKVLLWGTPGDVYNLPAQMKGEAAEHSPLSPMRVVTDASKLETINIY